jgi:phage-related tail fiber protein
MNKDEFPTCKGTVQVVINYKDGKEDVINFNNTILRTGRAALASALANRIGNDFDYFISKMIFGDGGTVGGTPRQVSDDRMGLYGSARVLRPVISNIDSNNPTQVIFTSVIPFDEGNGFELSEMALQLNNGDFYSMATFAGISKTSSMQITWNWRLSFI